MDTEGIRLQIRSFFRDAPCGNLQIPNCEELRRKYNKRLANGGRGCSKCRKNALKRNFKKIISQELSKEGSPFNPTTNDD